MGLVKIETGDLDIVQDIAYAGAGCIGGRPVYARAELYLIRPAVDALAKAAALAGAQDMMLRVYDGYRPGRVQAYFWSQVSDSRYVADPERGSPHTRGIAVDLTLQTREGDVLDMGTGFDALDERSHAGNMDIAAEAQRNRHILTGIMVAAGWAHNPFEWWHFNLPDPTLFPLIEDGTIADRMIVDWLKDA